MAMVCNGGLFGGSGHQGIWEAPVRVGTEDMKNAYRQIPLPDGQVAISITARAAFGAGHSVPKLPSCGRVDSEDLGPGLPASLRPLLRRLLLCGHRAGGHHSNLMLAGRIQAPGFPAGQ